MMGRHETHASPAQQRIANLMPLGGLADAGGSKGLGVAAFVFEEDETQPGSFKITTCGNGPGRAKSGKASGTAGSRLGRAGQAGGRMSGTGGLAAGHAARDDRRRKDAT